MGPRRVQRVEAWVSPGVFSGYLIAQLMTFALEESVLKSACGFRGFLVASLFILYVYSHARRNKWGFYHYSEIRTSWPSVVWYFLFPRTSSTGIIYLMKQVRKRPCKTRAAIIHSLHHSSNKSIWGVPSRSPTIGLVRKRPRRPACPVSRPCPSALFPVRAYKLWVTLIETSHEEERKNSHVIKESARERLPIFFF